MMEYVSRPVSQASFAGYSFVSLGTRKVQRNLVRMLSVVLILVDSVEL